MQGLLSIKNVLGRTNTKPTFFSHNSFADQLIALTPTIDIYIIPDKIRNNYKHTSLKTATIFLYQLKIPSFNCNYSYCYIIRNLVQDLGFGEANIIMVHIRVLATSLLTENLIYTLLLLSLVSVLSFNFYYSDAPYLQHMIKVIQ